MMSEPTKQDVPVWSDWGHEEWVLAAHPNVWWQFVSGRDCYYLWSGEEQSDILARGRTILDLWPAARESASVYAYEKRKRAEWEMREKGEVARPVPIGGDLKDFCTCGHRERNHANYAGHPRICNLPGCKCRSYVAEASEAKPETFEHLYEYAKTHDSVTLHGATLYNALGQLRATLAAMRSALSAPTLEAARKILAEALGKEV